MSICQNECILKQYIRYTVVCRRAHVLFSLFWISVSICQNECILNVGHHYALTNTNKENKTWALLQTTVYLIYCFSIHSFWQIDTEIQNKENKTWAPLQTTVYLIYCFSIHSFWQIDTETYSLVYVYIVLCRSSFGFFCFFLLGLTITLSSFVYLRLLITFMVSSNDS
jgi:hypothetical protein